MLTRRKRWTKERLEDAVKTSTSIRQVIKKLGLVQAGGNYEQVKKYIGFWEINSNHFKGKAWNKGMSGIGKPLYALEEILIENSTYQSHKLKNRLFKDKIKLPKCELCGWAKKAIDGRLPLELDHINGDKSDNRLKNLRVLCPNCHSLQTTHRGRKIKKK